MQVLGFGNQTVNALATATLAPAQTNCAVPMALCTLPGGSAPDYGYVVGNWYSMDFSDTGGNANYTGNFRWVDFDPSSSTTRLLGWRRPGACLPARRLGPVQPAAADRRQLLVERQLFAHAGLRRPERRRQLAGTGLQHPLRSLQGQPYRRQLAAGLLRLLVQRGQLAAGSRCVRRHRRHRQLQDGAAGPLAGAIDLRSRRRLLDGHPGAACEQRCRPSLGRPADRRLRQLHG